MPRKWRFTPEERALRAIQRMSLGGHMESSAPVRGGLSKETLALAAGAANAIDQVPWQQTILEEPGTLLLTAGLPGNLRWYPGFDGTIGFARVGVDTPATGTTVVDIYKNGSSIFSDPAHRPALYSGQNTALASAIDVASFVVGDYFTADIVQIGSSPGADLTVEIGGLPILGDPTAVGSGPSTRYSSAILADSPLLYFRLGDTSGTTVVDSSGNGHSGTYHGSPTLGAAGALAGDINTAVTFDGVNDYIDCAVDLSALDHYSVEFWLKVASFANNNDLVCEYSASTDANDHAFAVSPNSAGTLATLGSSSGLFAFGENGSFGTFAANAFTRPSSGAWHHYVLELDRRASPGVMQAYVDGIAQNVSPPTDAIGGSLHTYTLYLMSRAGSSLFLAGTLDEFAIYPTILSSTQVSNHHNAGI